MNLSFKKPLIHFTLIVWLLLLIPILSIISKYQGVYLLSGVIISSFSISVLLVASYCFLSKINKYLALSITLILFVLSFLIRLVLSLVYDFSGRGFTGEFFAHFSWASFKIGLSDYGVLFWIAISILILLVFLLSKLLIKIRLKKIFVLVVAMLLAVIVFFMSKNNSPEWQLFQSFNRYYSKEVISMDSDKVRALALKELVHLRPNKPLPIEKNKLKASLPPNPKNIIIIYLESFSEILSNNKNYPDLTPNIDQMKEDYFSFENNYSSAYVTIEGIANSQCGTLMNMVSENNSLTTRSGRLVNLPCLGDILNKAGYKQVFYGGAELEFAGKGAFLKDHGYDEVRGKLYWEKQNIGELNQWGLMDNNLFNEAFNRIKILDDQKQPYNFTMLTLGTHIPGFMYQGCKPYKDGEENFINAIHCTDYLLGQFIRKLKVSKLLENTVVYIQGDHTIFPTKMMMNLFGKESRDPRVLSVIIDKDLNGSLNKTSPTTSLNLVANTLDLLKIDNNSNFIFAESDFAGKKDKKKKYFMTRYYDYFGNKNVNPELLAGQCNNVNPIVPPLDFCEKNRALTRIYQLDNSYAQTEVRRLDCSATSYISINNPNRELEIIWAGVNVSKDFILQGRKMLQPKKGIYVLELTNKDQILSQQMYLPEKQDLIQMKHLLAKGSRFLIASNLLTHQLEKLDIKFLPKDFVKTKWVYVDVRQGKLIRIDSQEKPLGAVEFNPLVCNKEFKILSYQKETKTEKPNKAGFCKIQKWGPQKTLLGNSFNLQPTGLSAFWLKTQCAPNDVVLRVDGSELLSVINLPVITAAIDDKFLLNEAKTYHMDLYSPSMKDSQEIGEFIVIPNNSKPIILPKLTPINIK